VCGGGGLNVVVEEGDWVGDGGNGTLVVDVSVGKFKRGEERMGCVHLLSQGVCLYSLAQ
jgi:hypothetical protein